MTAIAFEQLLPWAQTQRWFPTDWIDAQWESVETVELGETTQILLAQPNPGSALLQIPIRWEGAQALEASTDPVFWADWLTAAGLDEPLDGVKAMGKEQSNTSVILTLADGRQWVAKLFRVVHPGQNPDAELPIALRAAGYTNTPAVRAHLEVPVGADTYTLAVATDMVPNTGTAWDYFRTAAELNADVQAEITLLGRRLGQLYQALVSLPPGEPTPTVSDLKQRVLDTLNGAATRAEFSDEFTRQLQALIEDLATRAVGGQVSRAHGDLHLGQILRTPGGDWQIIDFEGEPLRPIKERTLPDFALRDLAGMLRSISYAGWDKPEWAEQTRVAFLNGFALSAGNAATEDLALLTLLEIEKALYEVEYEAQFRPDWIDIPLSGIRRFIDS